MLLITKRTVHSPAAGIRTHDLGASREMPDLRLYFEGPARNAAEIEHRLRPVSHHRCAPHSTPSDGRL